MFAHLRKHQTWLLGVIVTITIVSFVVFFNPNNRGAGSSRGPVNFGSINGERITEEDFSNAQKEVLLQYYFMSDGHWLDNEAEAKKQGFDFEKQVYVRLLLIQKQEQLGIHVSSDVAGRVATDMLRRFESPTAFEEKILKPHRLQMSDLERFVRHNMGIQELASTIGLSGNLVTPQEAQSLYVREHEELSTEAIFFEGSNYLAKVSAPAEAVSQFYTNHIPDYEIPERVQVSYVKFGYSNQMAKVEKELTNLTEKVELNMQRLGTNYVRVGKTPEEARAKIREDLLLQLALPEVRKEAIAFAGPLAESTNAPTLEQLAKTNGLTVNVTPPFDIASGPTNIDVSGSDFTKIAFSLSKERPVPEPIITRDGVFVIEFKNSLPREIPPLEKIRDQVVADYKYNEAVKLARKAGAEFAQALTNSMAQGKTFDGLSAEAKLKPVALPPFSISTRSLPEAEEHIPLNGRAQIGLKQIAFSTPPGKASGFHETNEGGIIVYVKGKLPLDEAKVKSELPAFMSLLRQNRSREAFDMWLNREGEKGLRNIPYFQQRQQPSTAKS